MKIEESTQPSSNPELAEPGQLGALRELDQAIAQGSVRSLVLISKIMEIPGSPDEEALQEAACGRLGPAIWSWAPAHPEEARRFAIELAQGPVPSNAEAKLVGLAYLAAAVGSGPSFPFHAVAETTEQYDDEGRGELSTSAKAYPSASWAFPNDIVAWCAQSVFQLAMDMADFEGEDGRIEGSSIMDREGRDIMPALPSHAIRWLRIGAAADAAGAKSAIEAAAPASAARRGPGAKSL